MEYKLFNYEEYLKNNHDLVRVGINDKERAWKHWCFYGKDEGREWYGYDKVDKSISKEYFENNYEIYILRHINSDSTNKYWKLNYDFIRENYKDIKITIIDDSSNELFLNEDNKYTDVEFIYTEYNRSGEVLPYYYYLNKSEDTKKKYAIFIHDGVFIIGKIHELITEDEFTPLWSFESRIEMYKPLKVQNIKEIINEKATEKNKLIDRFNNFDSWRGVFGGMAIVSKDYIKKINERMDIKSLFDKINTREWRMAFERIVGILNEENNESLLGAVYKYNRLHFKKCWGIWLHDFLQNVDRLKNNNCKIVKVFTGR